MRARIPQSASLTQASFTGLPDLGSARFRCVPVAGWIPLIAFGGGLRD